MSLVEKKRGIETTVWVRMLLWVLLVGGGWSIQGVHAEQETAMIARDTPLYGEPSSSASVLATLPAKTSVVIQARTGAWAQVSTGQQQGYVRLLNLRTRSGKKGKSGLGSVVSVFQTGSSGQAVSTGIKGMSAEELENAAADVDQVSQLDAYRSSPKRARKEARKAGLKARKVPELPASR